MNIGVSTSCFYPLYTEDAISQIIDLSVNEIEVFFNSDSEFNKDYVKNLKEKLDDGGVKVKSVHPFTSAIEGIMFFSEYKRRTHDSIEQYKRYFEAASILGAKYFTFHGERQINLPVPFASSEIKYDIYEELCNAAREFGITFTQENVAWCKSSDPLYMKQLYDNIPTLGYTIDIKQAKRAGRFYKDYLDIVHDRVKNIHINDYNEEKSCLLPGHGVIDYKDMFKHLADIGYDDSVLIEVYSTDYNDASEIKTAVDYLKTLVLRD